MGAWVEGAMVDVADSHMGETNPWAWNPERS